MKATVVASCSLALACVVQGQSYLYSPAPSYASYEGGQYASSLGVNSDMRLQMGDATLRGASRVLKGIAFRHDGQQNYTVKIGMGRQWTTVALRMAETTNAKMTQTFSKNPTTPPTLVFSSKLAWPTVEGAPPVLPTPWFLQFPFSKQSWSYSGNRDVLTDFTFVGGVLANKAPWSGSSTYSYYLDSFSSGSYSTTKRVLFGESGYLTGCKDTAATIKNGAINYLEGRWFGPNYSNPKQRNGMSLFFYGGRFGTSAPLVSVLAFRAVVKGWTFPGVTCNKAYVDFTLPMLLFFSKASANGALPYTYIPGPTANDVLPADPAVSSLDLVLQTAWDDTVTKQVKLSAACRTVIPPLPPFLTLNKQRMCVYQGKNSYIVGPYDGPPYNPIVRYAQ